MLIVLVPLLAALAAPNPEPGPAVSPAPSALKEIGRVHALPVCSSIVVHANSAIGVALDNDRDLALTINRLRTTDLEVDNVITRRNGMNALLTLAARIRTSAVAGNGEIKRLRAMAGQTADPARKAELKAFADALGGAIGRQRKAGADLDRMLTIVDGRQAVADADAPDWSQSHSMVADPSRPALLDHEAGVMHERMGAPGQANDLLRQVADDFQARTQAILTDEGIAADHSLGATTGC
jgi:hypothetical protein